MALYKYLTANETTPIPANGAQMVGRSFANPEIRVLDADGTTYLWGSETTFHTVNRSPTNIDPVNSNSSICFPGGSTLTMGTSASAWISIESI